MTSDQQASITVFLLDDHEVVRRGVADVLEGDPGISVIGEGKNASEALARVPALKPDVAVLDVRDPQSYRQGHLPGAVLMTPEELSTEAGVAKLRGERRLIVAYCS